jgi:alpha-galactosidase
MAKVTFLGAGSTVFAKQLLFDLLSFAELADSYIVLFDIDQERLALSEAVARKLCVQMGVNPTIRATLDAERALEGADYVINMIQVGGYRPCTVTDFEIPKRFGLRQTIGDTVGIGGIMRALRTIPVVLNYCRILERVAPHALFLNYTNPMAMITMAILRATNIRAVGLCHSVFGTARELAHDVGVPFEEINYLCAGINHMAFFLKLEHRGKDLYPELRRIYEEGRVPSHNRVRYEILMHLGYFVTESSEHFAEYCPYFIKRDRPDLIERFNIPLDEYPRRCEELLASWETLQKQLVDPSYQFDLVRSLEYGTYIIHSIETHTPRVVYGNVLNTGLISNLPEGCCVELPLVVDRNGIQPVHVGPLPPQLAALIRTNVNVQELTVEAVLQGRRDHVYHAAMMDPHTAAELTLDEIRALVDALLEAHGEWIPASLR